MELQVFDKPRDEIPQRFRPVLMRGLGLETAQRSRLRLIFKAMRIAGMRGWGVF
jgi:hypothetical protein